MAKRILYLIPTFQGGGAEQQVVLLSRHLPALGWEVVLGHIHPGVHLDAAMRSGAQVERLSARGNYDPALLIRVRQLIRRSQPAIVQTWLPQMDIIGGMMARIAGLPLIISERSTDPMYGRPRVMAFARERIMNGATAVISNSEQALKRWSRDHPSVQRFYVPNAISLLDVDAIGPSDRVASLRTDPNVRVVIGVGRLVGLKRFDVFIDALKRVNAQVPAAGLICGEGPLREMLEARAVAAGMRVMFAGFVTDVASHIKSSDVLVTLSSFEGRPNVVVEGMAARTPLVLSDIPEHREILDASGSALFVPGDDPDAVAAAILDVFRHRDAADQRVARARQAAEEWSAPRIAAQHAAIYDQIAAR